MQVDLKARLGATAFAFRGYNVTNTGRSLELLEHATYGPLVESLLTEASEVCAEVTGKPTDLPARVRSRAGTRLDTFAEDLAQILAMEVAQVRLLKEFCGIDYQKARLAFGYSLGEVAALVCGGTLELREVLAPLLAMAPDAALLGRDVTMGVVFSRGAELDMPEVYRLCQEICCEDTGLIGVSAHLAPNAALTLGQRDTVDRLKRRLPKDVHIRENRHRWPPLHTPLLWEKCIPNRAGLMMLKMQGGLVAPQPPVFSLATGAADYNAHNIREILCRWIDHPQRLWDAIYATLAAGIDTVVHVGPEPNLTPATFRRISENVKAQLNRRSLNSLGLRAVSTIWRPWLARWLSARSALLRAPFIVHITLEDWLLERNGCEEGAVVT